jgi:hypothetical protein
LNSLEKVGRGVIGGTGVSFKFEQISSRTTRKS